MRHRESALGSVDTRVPDGARAKREGAGESSGGSESPRPRRPWPAGCWRLVRPAGTQPRPRNGPRARTPGWHYRAAGGAATIRFGAGYEGAGRGITGVELAGGAVGRGGDRPPADWPRARSETPRPVVTGGAFSRLAAVPSGRSLRSADQRMAAG